MVIQSILSSLLMIFLMVIPGVIFRKRRMITEEQGDAVNSIIVNLTWPCLVIDAMQMEFSAKILRESSYIFLICVIVFGCLFLLSFLLARWLKFSERRQYLMTFMLLFGNTGFIGIPVIRVLYGETAVFFMAVIEMINDILIFTVGIFLIQLSAGANVKAEWRKMCSPGMLGVLIGLVLFLCRIILPETLGRAVEMMGNATTPLTMFMIGFQLGGLRVSEIMAEWQTCIVSLFKLILVPALCLAVVMGIDILLPSGEGCFSLMEKVVVLSFAMPVGSVAAIFSRQYRTDSTFAVRTVLLSTLFCFITLPVFAILLEKVSETGGF